jgi:hypothetical protein
MRESDRRPADTNSIEELADSNEEKLTPLDDEDFE